jgi:hypothetical protein
MGELQRVLVMQDAWLRWISLCSVLCSAVMMRLCLLATASLLLAWCLAVKICAIPRCRPRLMSLPIVAFGLL